jgi:thiamine-phosphate pyrophosphorylase
VIPPLYAVVDIGVARRAGWAPLDLAAAFVAGGARLLQLRAKELPGRDFLDLASSIVAVARPAGAAVIVNDRADVARLAGADGVHVGQDDLPPAAVRRLLDERALVGLSTHSEAQAAAALEQPISYVAIGPVFGTATKATGYAPVGLEMVARVAALARPRGVPVVAIGGITAERAGAVLRAGAASVAIVSDLVAGDDPADRVRACLSRLSGGVRP